VAVDIVVCGVVATWAFDWPVDALEQPAMRAADMSAARAIAARP
jgi:hypothetical protein